MNRRPRSSPARNAWRRWPTTGGRDGGPGRLAARLDKARDEPRGARRRSRTDLQQENETLKTSSLYIATIEELTDDGASSSQHGNNQEVLTDVSPALREEIDNGDRVAINDSFTVQRILSSETDARAQAMEIDDLRR